jgi:hypothetical protein
MSSNEDKLINNLKAELEESNAEALAILKNILRELKLLRKDLKTNRKEGIKAADDYKAFMQKLMDQKVTSMSQIAFPNINPSEIKKNTAKLIKNMMSDDMLKAMPKDFQEGFFGLMQGISKPNDPEYMITEPDPREPLSEEEALKRRAETIEPQPFFGVEIPGPAGVYKTGDTSTDAFGVDADLDKPVTASEQSVNPECPSCKEIILPSDVITDNVTSDGHQMYHRKCYESK